jgi:uncharacterized protein YggT (Ycf19 family)
MFCIKHACAIIVIFIIMIMILRSMCNDGFRSYQEKKNIARKLVTIGEPVYKVFKKNNLDGVEYYDAKQLWNKNEYNVDNIESML